MGKKKRIAPHFHLHTLGTKKRRTKSGANRGRMKANSFVADAVRNPKPIVEKMRKKAAERTEIEVSRAAKT